MSFSSDLDEPSASVAAEEPRAKHLSPRVDQDVHDAPTEVDAPEREPPFAADRPPPARSDAMLQQLVEQGLSLIDPEAKKIARQLGHLADHDELLSVGRGALVEAARSFDPERSSFGAYARKRLRWAMFDSIRRDTHGRSLAARASALHAAERVVDAALATPPDPTLPESAHARRLAEVVAAQAAAMALGLSAPFLGTAEERAPEPQVRTSAGGAGPATPTPEDLLMRRRCAVALRGALQRLPPKQREIVESHYFGEERFDHIADRLGISKSWASRLHAQAMALLFEALRDHH